VTRSQHRIAGLGALAAAAYCAPALTSVLPGTRSLLGVADHTDDGLGCGLTFDDGPHVRGTPAVLDVLAARDTRATFFLVGEQVVREPGLAAEVAAAGHDVGIHCFRHRNLLALTPAQVHDDLRRARAAIEDVTGRPARLYRPPYGVLNAAALAFAHRAGWRTLLWTAWGRDWEARATPQSVVRRLTTGLAPGSVLLLHDADHYSAPDSWRTTVAALDGVIDAAERAGLAPRPA
jgi:peptidoglycan/xylan/chitin deacetylase (PgdA/CDA1 family)